MRLRVSACFLTLLLSSQGAVSDTKQLLYFLQSQTEGSDGVAGMILPTKVIVSPDGRHVYAAGFGSGSVVAFRRDGGSGALTFLQTIVTGVGGANGLAGAYAIALSPDGRSLYVAAQNDNSVVVFDRDSSAGTLRFRETHRKGQNGVDGLGLAKAVKVTSDGRHVYVLGYGDSAVVVFRRDPSNGGLTLAQVLKEGINGIRGIHGATSLDASADGRNVYVISVFSNALTVFARNPETGLLTPVEVHTQGTNGIDGLNYAYCVAVSPDDRNVYAVGTNSNAIAVFTRNTATGALTPSEVHTDGIRGVDGIAGTKSLAVSPDGRYVYVAGRDDNGLGVFRRNPETGALTFVEAHKNGSNGVSGLTWSYAVAVSPDSQNVYGAGFRDNAVTVFRVGGGRRRALTP